MNDTISRQAALDALNEQIEQCDKALSSFDISMKDEYAVKVERASLMAYKETIEYLPSAQPSATDTNVGGTDTISRAAASEAVCKMLSNCFNATDEMIESVKITVRELPSAQPETAKRIVGKSRDGMTLWYQCDMCNEPVDAQDDFCRGCGRRLISDLIDRQAALDIYDDYNIAVENGELESYRRYRKQMLELPPAQLAQDLPKGCTDTISRQEVIDAFAPYAEYESNRSNAEWVRRINMVLSALPSAHPDFSAYCDKVYQIALERGRREVIDFVSSMNMCDEVNDEAYTKLIMHFENIPLEGGQS